MRTDKIAIMIRFDGGETEILTVPLPPRIYEVRRTSDDVIGRIDALLEEQVFTPSRFRISAISCELCAAVGPRLKGSLSPS